MTKKLYRSRHERVLAGVIGGFSNFWGIDPGLLRVLVIFLGVITVLMPLAILYVACWIIMPVEPDHYPRQTYRHFYRSKSDNKMGGLCGGIADYTGWDSTVVRVIVVCFGLLTAVVPLLVAYLVGLAIVPQK